MGIWHGTPTRYPYKMVHEHDLEDIELIINTYDPCIESSCVNSTKQNLYVDEMKSSHIGSNVNDVIHNWLEKIPTRLFGNDYQMPGML
jgi:hypothetical protein